MENLKIHRNVSLCKNKQIIKKSSSVSSCRTIQKSCTCQWSLCGIADVFTKLRLMNEISMIGSFVLAVACVYLKLKDYKHNQLHMTSPTATLSTVSGIFIDLYFVFKADQCIYFLYYQLGQMVSALSLLEGEHTVARCGVYVKSCLPGFFFPTRESPQNKCCCSISIQATQL